MALIKKKTENRQLHAGTEFDAVDINAEGKWVPAACWFNCGGFHLLPYYCRYNYQTLSD